MSEESNKSTFWKQNLRAVWFAELVAIVGFAIVIPILPLYVREMGVTGDRQVRIWAGIIYSAQAVTMAIFAPIWGALSDRHGRKVMVERAMFGGSVVITLMGLAQTPQQLALLRAVQGCLTGTTTAATALVATSAPADRAGYALGTLQMAIYIGASAGPLLGGIVADTFGYRTAFFVTGVLLFIAALAVLLFVREPSQTRDQGHNPSTVPSGEITFRQRILDHLSPVLQSTPLLTVLGIRLVIRLASRLPRPTLPLFVEAIAPPDTRVATITGFITGAGALGGALGGRELGKLGDRIGYRSILAVCALVSVLCYTPQVFVDRSIWLIPLQAGAGIAMGGIIASISASLATLSPDGREGIVYGVDASVVSVANAIGPMIGSSLAAWIGLRAPFPAAAVIFAVGGIAALRLLPGSRPSTS